MKISLIAALDRNHAIGRAGVMPWHLPDDLKRFKQLTLGKPMLMGRKTFDTLPGLLPGRRHIVLTRDDDWRAEGAEVVHDIATAIKIADAPELAVVGGAEVYALALPYADRIKLTEIALEPQGDTIVPPFDPADWIETRREDHPAEDGRPAFSFVTLVRHRPRSSRA